MTALELCEKALDIQCNYKTAYMWGPWGWPTTEGMIKRAENADVRNKLFSVKAREILNEGFMFDCVGLFKGIMWGFNGDSTRVYGGAGYIRNGVPDTNVEGFKKMCYDLSNDFSEILPGELVFMTGHMGIYVGNGNVVESTPKWDGGVQLSSIYGGKKVRKWKAHGKYPAISYKIDKEDIKMRRYNTYEEIPENYREAVEICINAGALQGRPDGLDISEDMCRILTILNRLGILEDKNYKS